MLKRSMIHDCYAYSYPETLAASGFQENLKNFEQHLSIMIDSIYFEGFKRFFAIWCG